MKILSIVKIVVAIAVLVGITAFFLNKNKTTQAAKIEAAQISITPSVQVATVQRQTLQGTTEFIGKTEFLKEVLMTATTQGVVKEVYFKLNGFVTEGASLLKVDTDLSNAALDIAQTNLEKAKRDLMRLELLKAENTRLSIATLCSATR